LDRPGIAKGRARQRLLAAMCKRFALPVMQSILDTAPNVLGEQVAALAITIGDSTRDYGAHAGWRT